MLGNTSISKLYVGSTEVSKAYLGSTEVYSSEEFLLDTYGSAGFALAFRELTANRSAFTSIGDTGTQTSGVWNVQVRRSSDNAQKSFTTSEVTDGTLETWVGTGNDGFVSRWYDQSGNSNHAFQTTTARQPILVQSGTVSAENGVPAMRGSIITDVWLNMTTALAGDESVFSSYRAFYDSTLIVRHTGGSAHSMGSRGTTANWLYQTNAGSFDLGISHPTSSVVAQFQCIGTAQSVHANDALVMSRTASAANTANIGRIMYYTFQSGGLENSLTEIVAYTTDKSSDRSNIFANMNAFYGAY